MVLKVKDVPDELPLRTMLHILIAMVLASMLLVKVLIARYYKSFTTALVPLGLTIFTLGFVLIASAAGPYLLHRVTIKGISLQSLNMGAFRIDLKSSEALMQRRCSRCHALDRVVGARKDAQGWLVAVNRTRALPGSGMTESDAKVILSYLISESSIDSSSAQGELVAGKALVDSHCNRCHGLDRTYQSIKSPAECKDTVMRTVKYARGTGSFFKPGEEPTNCSVSSMTQTPEATQARLSSPTDLTRTVDALSQKWNLPKISRCIQLAHGWRNRAHRSCFRSADVAGRPKSPSQKRGTASATSLRWRLPPRRLRFNSCAICGKGLHAPL